MMEIILHVNISNQYTGPLKFTQFIGQLYPNKPRKKAAQWQVFSWANFLLRNTDIALSSLENNKSIEECNYHRKKSQNLTRIKPSLWWYPQLPSSVLALFDQSDKTPTLVKTIPSSVSPHHALEPRRKHTMLTTFTWKPWLLTSSGGYQSRQTCCISKIHLLQEASAHFFPCSLFSFRNCDTF